MDRTRAIYGLRPRDQSFDDWYSSFTEYRLVGTVDEVVDALLPYAAAGADRITIMHILHRDLDSIRLIGERIGPRLEASATPA